MNKKIVSFLISVLCFFGFIFVLVNLIPEVFSHVLGALIFNGLTVILAFYIFFNPRFLTEEKPGTSEDFKYRNITIKTWHKITRVFSVFVFFIGVYLCYPVLKDVSGFAFGGGEVITKTAVLDADTPGPMPQTWFLIQNVLLKGEKDVFYTFYFSKVFLTEGLTYDFKILKNSNVIISAKPKS